MKGGFKYEREITIAGVVLGIVSTVLLLKVLTLQHKYFSMRIDQEEKDNGK